VSGKTVEHWSDVEDLLLDKPAEPKTIRIRSGGTEREVQFHPRRKAPR